MTAETVLVGERADPVPVGHVAGQVREQHRARGRGSTISSIASSVDEERVGLDVDEHGNESGADQWREVGRERERRGDDLRPGRQVEQLDGEIQRRRARVAHHARRLAEQLRDPAFHLGDVPADAQRPAPAVEDAEHGVDLGVVEHRGGVQHTSLRHHLSFHIFFGRSWCVTWVGPGWPRSCPRSRGRARDRPAGWRRCPAAVASPP